MNKQADNWDFQPLATESITKIQSATNLDDDERVSLSTAIQNRASWLQIRHLRPTDFESPSYRLIWICLSKAMLDASKPNAASLSIIDPNIDQDLVHSLQGDPAYGASTYLAAANRLVTKRRKIEAIAILRAASRRLETAQKNDDGTTQDWQTELGNIVSSLSRLAGHNASDNANNNEALVRHSVCSPTPLVPTGLTRLDKFLGGGLKPGAVLAVGATTKVGKTVLAATISHNFENRKDPISHLIISLDRSADEIGRLKLARKLGISASTLNSVSDLILAKIQALPDPGTFCQTMHLLGATITDLESEITHQTRVNNIQAVLIDYMQLIGGKHPRETDESHMTNVAQTLQRIAFQNNIAILVMVMEDDLGQIWRRASAIKISAVAYLVLHRDKSAAGAYFETKASALIDESDIGTINEPALILDPSGPHFK